MFYLDNRLYEWSMATAMTVFGVMMLLWPRMSNGSILHLLTQYVSGEIIALIFLVTGALRIAALIANGGSMWIGPRIRSVSAIISACLWAEFTLSMIEVSYKQGFPSPMVPFWFTFMIAELYVTYRAGLDVRSS
jgi:hypothetical protein